LKYMSCGGVALTPRGAMIAGVGDFRFITVGVLQPVFFPHLYST